MSPQNRGEAWGDRASQPGAVGEVAETSQSLLSQPQMRPPGETPHFQELGVLE